MKVCCLYDICRGGIVVVDVVALMTDAIRVLLLCST
jgi:hypothetical protein